MATNKGVLSTLDKAKTQRYHYKAIGIAGMGFFTDAYDLFCITAVIKLIGRLYYYDPMSQSPGKLPKNVSNAITGVALCGSLLGQLFFGWLGDKLGRKKVYGITLATMVGCALASGLSFGSTAKSVVATLCFFRFWLGFGIGGDYPLSAVIMSECANTKTRGAFVAAVFAMQGVGILFAGGVAMLVSKLFLWAYPACVYAVNPVQCTQPQGDFVWRIVLMFGAFPAAFTYYWRMKMPETARYTFLVEGNHKKAVEDMAKVLENDVPLEESNIRVAATATPSLSYGFISSEFLEKHGLHLLGTTSTWFFLDIAFYSLQLTQQDIYPATGFLPNASQMNGIEEVFQLSKAMSAVALFATVPGYWCTVYFIDKIGRFKIQLGGFFAMSVCMLFLGLNYTKYREDERNPDENYDDSAGKNTLFVILFEVTLFFSNFGPNSTTFIVAAELFPARFRSTCHGISAAAGKAGAIIGAFVVQSYINSTQDKSEAMKTALMTLSVVNMLGFLCTFLVPETRGRSLEEISGEDKELTGNIAQDNANEKTTDTEKETKNSNADISPANSMV
ncbi:MFS transporter [Vigna unguiculata]|uniref:MFS transporter n=1 Tax=Vigna unguiculata TaxID=3917 RepID=A0A4D6MJ66_VIGUN|nr:MFS transporter [Vigna unguiculata]